MRIHLSDGSSRAVKLGRRSGGRVVVAEGLQEGETVLLQPPPGRG